MSHFQASSISSLSTSSSIKPSKLGTLFEAYQYIYSKSCKHMFQEIDTLVKTKQCTFHSPPCETPELPQLAVCHYCVHQLPQQSLRHIQRRSPASIAITIAVSLGTINLKISLKIYDMLSQTHST